MFQIYYYLSIMEATIYVQENTGSFHDWYLTTSSPVNLTLNYYLTSYYYE